MPVEQDALGFEDENDVFWVGAIHDSRSLCAEELIGFVNFFKHILKNIKKKVAEIKFIITFNLSKVIFVELVMTVRTLPSGFLSGWYFCASLK